MPRVTPSELSPDFDNMALMTGPQVRKLTGLSHCSIMSFIKDGCMPQPIRLGKRRLAWRQSEIMLYLKHGTAWRDHLPEVANHE